MMVPKTTADTLKHKINPSLELAAPQAIDVLLYTPGISLQHTHTHSLTGAVAHVTFALSPLLPPPRRTLFQPNVE